jgi:asparagine synthetase B (glutamine-hydrolysing)
VSKLAAEHGVKVLLTGIGGDELFFGYGWVRRAVALALEARRPALAVRRVRHARGSRVDAARGSSRTTGCRAAGASWSIGSSTRPARSRSPGEWVFYQLDYH